LRHTGCRILSVCGAHRGAGTRRSTRRFARRLRRPGFRDRRSRRGCWLTCTCRLRGGGWLLHHTCRHCRGGQRRRTRSPRSYLYLAGARRRRRSRLWFCFPGLRHPLPRCLAFAHRDPSGDAKRCFRAGL